jgi:transposase
MKLFTTTQVAEMTGIKRRSVTLAANRYGVGTKMGRDWLFTAEDIVKLKGRPGRGRPPKVKEEPAEVEA